jgi:GT2 family glycosyltransferase
VPAEPPVAAPEPAPVGRCAEAAALVTALVVNHQGGAGLVVCLESLRVAGLAAEAVLVVDNASTDGSDRAAEEAGVRLLRTGENLGYAGAVNAGLPLVTTPYLVVLNMDLRVEPGWLEPLIETLASDPAIGAVCPLILLDASGHVNAAGQSVTMSGLGFNRFLNSPAERVPADPHEVGGIHGAAVALRTSVLRELGGWDDSGFLYHEDVELSWLLRLTGHRLLCDPRSRVWHDYELSMAPHKLELLERNRKAMLRTHLKPATRRLLAPLLLADDAVVWGFAVLRGRQYVAAKWRAARWVRSRRPALAIRRAEIDNLRQVGDRTLLRGMRVGYPLAQLLSLGRERAPRRDRLTARHPAPGVTPEPAGPTPEPGLPA